MDLESWLALTNLSNIKKINLYNNYKNKKSINLDICTNECELITQNDKEKLMESFNEKTIIKFQDIIKKENIKFTIYGEKNYPKQFYNIDEPPFILFYKGDLEKIYNKKSIAIIGSRNCSEYGREVVKYIVNKLRDYDVNIISGGARGIDTICHKECLKNKICTTAILGCGLDVTYPRENYSLFKSLINAGVIISEFTPQTKPFAYNFPRRNRLISGLSDLIIVVEGSEKSGTLTTVSHALNQGKDVMAVPGPIYSEVSKGCNKLIKDGAYPFTDIDDIFQVLKMQKKENSFDNIQRKYNNSELKDKICNIINNEPIHIDSIIKLVNIDIKVLYELLFELQFEERILCINNNFYVKSFS